MHLMLAVRVGLAVRDGLTVRVGLAGIAELAARVGSAGPCPRRNESNNVLWILRPSDTMCCGVSLVVQIVNVCFPLLA